eukprot:gnl/MRDRNA2_/MRDRNA2_94884_c0_seq1.p1 gnl/MRDRNA2_/MRDRNA2_94884_c0~~gnl/MRDRNA2_/MRDRNA2_94884_c0_seq1.p1  ORF type:complete len:290 (-),score=50.02 gnl/MRDRNA2_/MRDRNA2_94884_c0_seq1:201-1070(-)
MTLHVLHQTEDSIIAMRISWLVVLTSCILLGCEGVSKPGKKQNALTVEVESSGSVRSHKDNHSVDQRVRSDTVRSRLAQEMTSECSSAVGGFYIDPKHYQEGKLAGTRMISIADSQGQIVLIGSDDGKEFWKLTGKSTGDCGSFAIDFSPKGGPADAVSTYENGLLKFGDGNAWAKKAQREPLKATGTPSDKGGFYTDPNHFHESDMSWAGTRYVSQKEGNELSTQITIVGSDDGTTFYALAGVSLGEIEMTVDFSPKNGPKDLSATFEPTGGAIHWPDGNVWSRVKAM